MYIGKFRAVFHCQRFSPSLVVRFRYLFSHLPLALYLYKVLGY
jgi:hypothetical protein